MEQDVERTSYQGIVVAVLAGTEGVQYWPQQR